MSDLHFQKPQKKKPSAGKGFYIALGACLIAIGAASWATYDSLSGLTEPSPSSTVSENPLLVSSSKAPATSQQGSPATSKPQTASSKNSAASSKQPAVSSKAPAVSSKAPASSIPVKPTIVTPTTFIMPTNGTVIKNYSDGESMYSLTFGDWRIHEGVDIGAPKGSTVKSIGAGKVSDVYKDDMLGTVVVIAHDGGLTVSYCGLAEQTPVKKGESVKQGQVIGSVDEVPCEVVDESHIHLEVKKDGKLVEPMAAIGKESEKAAASSTPSEKE